MMTDFWYVQNVDHRISTGLIFFLLLILLGDRRKRRAAFALRLVISLVTLVSASWCIRSVVDVMLAGPVMQGVGHSVHLLVMSLLYWAGYAFCYEAETVEVGYIALLALTIYKMAWNTFKTGASFANMTGGLSLWSQYSLMGAVVSYLTYAAVCLSAGKIYRMNVKAIPAGTSGRPMLVAYGAFLLCQLVLEFCGRVFTADHSALFLYHLCALMYTLMNYVALITIMRLTHYRRDNEDMHRFIRNKKQYYEMSRDGILSLQIKCHDLKHQIALIRSKAGKASFDKYIDRLEDSIIEYGTVVDCGNEPLNIVLTEKNILCSTGGVKFSYIIDGALFDFMTEMEIFSLFGNALDNAFESCQKVEDPEMRMISLKAVARGDMVVLHVENTFAVEPTLVGGMPVTNKGSGHGFGFRSIQQIAEKYGGAASVQVEGSIFKLTVFLVRTAPDKTE